MQDIGMLLWQGLGPYIHNSQYVPPFVQVDSSIPILLCELLQLDAWLPELLEAKVASHWRIPNSLKPAMSINKAQGQSLKIAGIDLKQPCFSHGQLYVACSRVGSGRNLCFGSRK
ncbi:hypothetical protein LAZ67_14000767 [Cordylochernes scorpioides]|uniref:Uncharacterized protein n=1 Tax=Cordylochernes scorpioides TaxID=51811 RepID=A0ABY6L8B0_9ARAC|nr:hypothetical protein LAZ67_14000767 [Cordylochernes scorpioides]